ncbi:Ovarian tumor, otubain [Artemisia annua]|uniref:Ovarian tumor, otubain n=1 Tax=Artemisia annua TaxID=35608 RepID=A0A2U1N6M7_ARTAN|nr:Ovarian tumor, otubain [Artemisia annua]
MVKTKINKKPKPNNNNKQQHNVKKNGKKSDISEFRAQLDALGLKIIEVTADRNCFFWFVYMLLSNLLNTKLLKVIILGWLGEGFENDRGDCLGHVSKRLTLGLKCNLEEVEDSLKNGQIEFQKRALYFIEQTRLVQGARHFMGWKVYVDSVVGAFLTQNTSDKSSFTYMSLSSKYRNKNTLKDLENNNHTKHALD